MQRKYIIGNWLLFMMSCFLLAVYIDFQFKDEFVLLNESVAMFLFCISFPLKIYNVKFGQYLILAAILILLFSPLNYSFTITNNDTSVTHSGAKSTSLISPITFVIFILYLMFNYQAMIDLYQLLTRGSEKEQEDKLSQEIEFYYSKFSGCSNTELVDIFKMYNDYPVGAQLALKKIKKEKEIN